MKADVEAQRRLLDLQAVDTAIAQLEHRRRSLPEHAAIADGQRARARLGEALVAARTSVSDLELEVAKAENDLVPVRERRVRDRQRLDDGLVNDPKALSALMDEITHLGKRINDLEDIQLELMERLEQAQSERDSLLERRGEVENSLRALIASRDEQTAELDAELAVHQRGRAALVAVLPGDLVALYDRLRVKSGGLGAAALRGRRCSGCQLEATATALAEYAAAPADDVLRCEECQRILVRDAGGAA